MVSFKYVYLTLLCLTGPLLVVVYQRLRYYSKQSSDHSSLVQKPGHLKPFGCCGERIPVDSVTEWPRPRDFFQNYVAKKKPLLIKNGARISPAFGLWTDEYFLEVLDVPPESTVNIETGKKEVRGNPTTKMNFKDWVRVYNDSDRYMVQDLPPYLGKDIIYPPSVQCDGFPETVVTGVMWFSSGGTKSVVHTDSADNMNCLYRGKKSLILVDPDKHGGKVPIDRPHGTYSTIDVDSVDYTKYPDLPETVFHHARMESGDCLYIPYLWIHQVNSFGSNLAVNLWWDHERSVRLDVGKCREPFDKTMTMDKLHDHKDAVKQGLNDDEADDETESLDQMKGKSHPTEGAMSFENFVEEMVEDVDHFTKIAGMGYIEPLRKIFAIMDKNGDGLVRGSEFDTFTQEENTIVNRHFEQFMTIRSVVEQEMERELPLYKKEL